MSEMLSNGNQTEFSYQPLQLNCGEFVCDDRGVIFKGKLVCAHPIIPVEKQINANDKTMKIKIKSFLAWAKQHNYLYHEKNRNTITKRINGQKPVRCFVIRFDWE